MSTTSSLLIIASLICLAAFVQSLRYQDEEEGQCINIRPARNVNTTWLANTIFPYTAAGNKYHLYRIASISPRFVESREFEFYYDVCLQNQLSFPTESGSASAFGERLPGNYAVRPVTTQLNTFDFVALPESLVGETSTHTIVLTDNRTFVLFNNCWTGSNQRGWDLVATTPGVDKEIEELVKDYMEAQGFSRDKFVFFRYDTCSINNPGRGTAPENRARYHSSAVTNTRSGLKRINF